jgi:hypothetical protein
LRDVTSGLGQKPTFIATRRAIAELGDKIAALKEMRDTLRHLAHDCDGDHRPGCPIIGSLEGTVPLPESHHHHHHHAPVENLKHAH